jgi:hypothetical protein
MTKEPSPMNVLPELRAAVVGAAATRPRRRPPRALAPAAAVVALAGGVFALAGALHTTSAPSRPAEVQATPTADPATTPPADQLARFAVLRRAPTADDAAALAELQGLSRKVPNVRDGYVRSLGVHGGKHVILYSQTKTDTPADAPAGIGYADPLCVLYPDPVDGYGGGCYNLHSILAHDAWGSLGLHVHGLVPDGVATVIARFADGTELRADVHDNFFEFDGPANMIAKDMTPETATFSWLDAAGNPIS